VALTELASDVSIPLVFQWNVKRLKQSETSSLITGKGDNVGMSAILGPDKNPEVWLVTYSGAFSPKRVPAGIKAPIYSKIDIFLDGKDGSVIGVHMHNQQ